MRYLSINAMFHQSFRGTEILNMLESAAPWPPLTPGCTDHKYPNSSVTRVEIDATDP
jgi:hypothetical protein